MPAKFNILAAASIPLVPLIPLLACGGSSSKTPDASIHVIDSPGSGSGSATCSLPANLNTPTFSGSSATYYPGSAADATNEIVWRGGVAGATSPEQIVVLILGGCGTTGSACGGANFATPDWPTNFAAKSNLDLSMVPDALVAVEGNLDMTTNPPKFKDLYFAISGTLNVTQASNTVGQPFAGTASNIVAQHYDLGSNSATPDPDNCMTQVTSFNFTATTGSAGSAVGKVIYVDGTDRAEAMRNFLAHRYTE